MNLCEKIVSNIQNELTRYIKVNKIKSLVLGVSGGIDSALCAALARPVCDKLKIKLYGRSLPIKTNKKNEIERAILVGEAFCNDFKETNLCAPYVCMDAECFFDNREENEINEKIREGNIKARIRMIYLYDLARSRNGIVLSTDNFTEYLLGFWTLHGDVGDVGMIQSLWKTEVYSISEYLQEYYSKRSPNKSKALKVCIEAVPTDGLGITNSDLDQIGANSYKEVDNALIYIIRKNPKILKLIQKKIVKGIKERYIRTEFKRNNPYNFSRELLFK